VPDVRVSGKPRAYEIEGMLGGGIGAKHRHYLFAVVQTTGHGSICAFELNFE
jgi:hypothetical protein